MKQVVDAITIGREGIGHVKEEFRVHGDGIFEGGLVAAQLVGHHQPHQHVKHWREILGATTGAGAAIHAVPSVSTVRLLRVIDKKYISVKDGAVAPNRIGRFINIIGHQR